MTASIAGTIDVANASGTSARGGWMRLERGHEWATRWTVGNDRGKQHTTTRQRTKRRTTGNGVGRGEQGRV